MEEEIKVKNNTKKGKGGLIFLVILVLAIIAGAVYFYLSSKPSKVFEAGVKSLFEEANEVTDELYDYENFKTDMELSVKLDSDDQISNLINNLKIKILDYSEVSNKNSESNIKILDNNDELLNFYFTLNDNETIIECPELYSKSVSISKELIEQYSNQLGIVLENTADFDGDAKVALERFKEVVLKDLNKLTYTRESVTTKIDEDEIKANKNTVSFTMVELKNALKDLERHLKADKEFTTALGNKKTFVFDEYDELIQNIKSLEEIFGENTKLNVSIYTQGLMNKFLKFEIVAEDEKSCAGMELYKKSEDDYIIIGKISEETSNFDEAEDLIKAEVTNEMMTMESEEFSFNLKYTENSMDLVLKTNIFETDATININMNVEKNVEHNVHTFSDKIEVEEMSEEDYQEILGKLGNNKIFSILSVLIGE